MARVDMSHMLQHIRSWSDVNKKIAAEEDRVVVIHFGHDDDKMCMQMDEVLSTVAKKLKKCAIINLVGIRDDVREFNKMYELSAPCNTIFFFQDMNIGVHLEAGCKNKIDGAITDRQEFVNTVEAIYDGAIKGQDFVIAPYDYATNCRNNYYRCVLYFLMLGILSVVLVQLRAD